MTLPFFMCTPHTHTHTHTHSQIHNIILLLDGGASILVVTVTVIVDICDAQSYFRVRTILMYAGRGKVQEIFAPLPSTDILGQSHLYYLSWNFYFPKLL